jgi:hypothetical protein
MAIRYDITKAVKFSYLIALSRIAQSEALTEKVRNTHITFVILPANYFYPFRLFIQENIHEHL